MADNSNDPQINELVSFIQHDLPGLEDGKYQLNISQEVKDAFGAVVSDGSLSATYDFAVTGDRFSLSKPAQTIYSVFPADNASGKYNTVLPSIVFTKTSFPWTRSPYKGGDGENNPLPPAGTDTDEEVPTWLTVILLDEDDVNKYATAFPAFALPPQVVKTADLFLTSVLPESNLQDNYSYFYAVTDNSRPLSTYLDPGQQLTDSLQVIDIPIPLFQDIAPATDDLKLMAHVRKVSLINKPTMYGISDKGEPEGSFSIVFGNRLPNPEKKNYAYLVSVEGLEDFLPALNGGAASGSFTPDPAKMLRLAVLNSWTFYTTGDNASFVNQMNALNSAMAPVNNTVNADLSLNTNLRLIPGEGAVPEVANALNMGYVPLNHNLRSGSMQDGVFTADKTVSWYRGPLTPYKIDKASIQLPIASPDQVLIFDPTTGMLDTSYAAAWTLGRQLSLQDKAFSTSLYNWKKGLEQEVINNNEMSLLAEHFSNVFRQVPEHLVRSAASAREEKKLNKASGNFLKNTILSLQPKKK